MRASRQGHQPLETQVIAQINPRAATGSFTLTLGNRPYRGDFRSYVELFDAPTRGALGNVVANGVGVFVERERLLWVSNDPEMEPDDRVFTATGRVYQNVVWRRDRDGNEYGQEYGELQFDASPTPRSTQKPTRRKKSKSSPSGRE